MRWSGVCSVDQGGLPAERGQLARDGDRHDVGVLAAAGVQVLPAGVQAPLGAPGAGDHAWVLVVLAALELEADGGAVAVVLGGLDEQPAGMSGAGLGDVALAAALAGGVLGRHDPDEPGQLPRPAEALEVADLGGQARRAEGVDPSEAA